VQKMMKAVVKAKREPGLWLEEVPVPEVGGDDVLIRVLKTSICGTDVHIYNWDSWAQKTIPVPMTIGHEFTGVVDAVGDHVKGFARGDLVVGEGHITCGHCRNCLAGRRHLCPNTLGVGVDRPGAWAEFVAIPQENCWHADPSIPLDVLSCFDPLGNAVHTALSFDLVGEDVLITGAGPIGCMAIPICKRAGARHVVVTDVNPYRLNLARTMGADLALDVRTEKLTDAMQKLGMKEGFDVGRLQRAYHQRHLWPRNVRNLVQNDGHDPEWSRHFSGDHASLSVQPIQRSHRADEIRQLREDRAQLGRAIRQQPRSTRMSRIFRGARAPRSLFSAPSPKASLKTRLNHGSAIKVRDGGDTIASTRDTLSPQIPYRSDAASFSRPSSSSTIRLMCL
jgi:D-arabinose 1-dehydrogenase-like Zn-dependent alcohol dehydrogenase